ncbi:unnamed protein product [Camellia sinensis]
MIMDAHEVVMLKQDGSNYPNWSHFMSQHMIQTRRQLWDYVCGIVTEPNPGHENFTNLSQQWKTKNAEILNMICIYVLNPSVSIQLRSFKSGKEAWDYLAELYGHSNFAKKYQLEAQIRATKQGDRTIKEFHGVMVGLWNQQAKLEDRDLSLLSSYKKNRETNNVFVEKAVRELEEEEMRLNKPSVVSEFDRSHKFNKPSSSRDRSATSSSSLMTKTYDWPSLLGGLAKVATFSFAAVQVSQTLYNYYTEPVAVESFSGMELKILSYNVCYREDLEIHKRLKAVGDLIQLHSPDEVTLNIYDIFQQSSWWKLYRCLVSNEMAYTRRAFCMQD